MGISGVREGNRAPLVVATGGTAHSFTQYNLAMGEGRSIDIALIPH